MKITAGILLLIAAISNFGAGLIYSSWGNSKTLNDTTVKKPLNSDDLAKMEEVFGGKSLRILNYPNATIKNIAYLMFVTALIMAIGAMLLLTDKKTTLILIAGATAIGTELLMIYLTYIGILSIFGIIAGGFAVYANFLPKEIPDA